MRPRDIVRPTPPRVTDCAVQCAAVCYSVLKCATVEGEGVVGWEYVDQGLGKVCACHPAFVCPQHLHLPAKDHSTKVFQPLSPQIKNLYSFQHISLLVKRDTHDDNWKKGMQRINWVMQIDGKRRHRVIGSLPIARARRSDQR